jgi:pimeloyl-ACP methyl ester carboxylesterase
MIMEWINKQKINVATGETLAYIDTQVGEQVIVLLHGNLSSSYHWLPLVHELKAHYRVIAFDLRGFGDSSYQQRFDHLDVLADDVISALTILNIQHYFLAGWSAGGGVAMSIAARDSRVKRLILMSSMSYRGLPIYRKDEQGKMMLGATYESKDALANDPVSVKPILNALAKQDHAYMTWLWNVAIYTVHQPEPEIHKVLINESLKQRNLIDIDWAIMHFHYGAGQSDYAKGTGEILKIQVPVLSLWGKQDKTVLEFMVRETAFVFGDRCEFIMLDACGHNPLVDQLEIVKKSIVKFTA